jgi:hypothetical protein
MSEAEALERLREQGEAKARSARPRALAVPEALWIAHPGRNEGTRRVVAERLRLGRHGIDGWSRSGAEADR